MSQSVEVRSLRPWLLGAGCLVVVGLLVVLFAQAPQLLARLQMYDFLEYWAAGRLLAFGDNPYDGDRMHALEHAAGRTEDGILMWNPPRTLPLVLPFGLLPDLKPFEMKTLLYWLYRR